MLVAVENVLDTWPGTLILVSHDRYLMERVTDDQYALIGGKVVHVPRGVDEYLELLQEYSAGQSTNTSSKQDQKKHHAASDGSESVKTATAQSGDDSSHPALSAAQARDIRKKLQSLERKMNTAQRKVDEAKKAQLAVDPYDYVALGEAQEVVKSCEDKLSALEEEWLECAALLEG